MVSALVLAVVYLVWAPPSADLAAQAFRAHLFAEHGFGPGSLDLLFIDHDKSAYLSDLRSILDRGWLHPGSIVVADNILVPGAPEYRAFMREQQGRMFDTVEHRAHGEYQSLLPDMVLESEFLGGG